MMLGALDGLTKGGRKICPVDVCMMIFPAGASARALVTASALDLNVANGFCVPCDEVTAQAPPFNRSTLTVLLILHS
jgi:hypothetical protein